MNASLPTELPRSGGMLPLTSGPGRRRKELLRLSGLFGLGVFAVVLLEAGWADLYRAVPRPAPGNELEIVQKGNRGLAMEIELASLQQPYWVLDLSAPSLTLKAQGVSLRSFPVLDASFRSLSFLGLRSRGMPALDTVWQGGILLPPRRLDRLVILADTVGPPDKDGTVSFIPPAPEEENPTRPSFLLRFGGGLSTFVLAEEAEAPEGEGIQPSEAPATGGIPHASPITRLVRWIRMDPWRRDPVRLDLTLPAPEAGAFYRAFTDGTPLLVLGGES